MRFFCFSLSHSHGYADYEQIRKHFKRQRENTFIKKIKKNIHKIIRTMFLPCQCLDILMREREFTVKHEDCYPLLVCVCSSANWC